MNATRSSISTPVASVDRGRPTRRLDVQGLRAIAVLLVVTFHSGLPIPGGYVGVDVFFVISGFVITGMLMREWAAHGRIRFGRFYSRRFKRLYPALAVMVATVFILALVLQSPFGAQQETAATGLGALLLTANIVIAALTGGYFDAPAALNPLLNTWSLSVEEQFYLAFPVILLVGWLLSRRSGREVWPWLVVGAVTVGSFAIAWWTSVGGTLPRGTSLVGFYGPLGRAWEFGVGALVALGAAHLARMRAPWTRLAAVVGMVLVAFSAIAFNDLTPFPGTATLVPVVGTALVIAAGSGADRGANNWLTRRPLTFIGDVSYSWYLWHWPLIVFARLIWPGSGAVLVLVGVLSFLPAWGSYRWLEGPLRHLSTTRKGLFGLVAAVMVPALSLGVLLWVGAAQRWWTTWPHQPSFEDGIAAARGCHNTPLDPAKCTWSVDGAEGTVLLAGDSQAFALADGLVEANSRARLNTVVSSQNACPLIRPDSIRWNPRFVNEKAGCGPWQAEVLDYALRTKPEVVVISNRSPFYANPANGYGDLISSNGTIAGTVSEAAHLWGSALNDVVRTLRQAGIGVVVVGSPPEGAPTDVRADASLLNRAPTIPDRSSVAAVEANRGETWRAERKVAAENPGTVLVDPLPQLCDENSCPGAKDGRQLYSDPSHLSREGSLLLTKALAEAVQQARATATAN